MKRVFAFCLISLLAHASYADKEKSGLANYGKEYVEGMISGIDAANQSNLDHGRPPIICMPHYTAEDFEEKSREDHKQLLSELDHELSSSVVSTKYQKYTYGTDIGPLPNMVIYEVMQKRYPCEKSK